MEEKRIFQLNGEFSLEELVRLLEQFLRVNKNLTTQRFDFAGRAVLQCMDSDSSWKQFLGLDAALTIELMETENDTLTVSIGNAKWLDKVGAAAVGALFFTPLTVIAGIGAIRQAVLPTEIFSFIETKTGKKSSKSTPFQSKFFVPEEPEEKQEKNNTDSVCPCCGSKVLDSYTFCAKCGTKL